jgi:thiosulfate/3-mercaptopyruvate sulfurtransferase
VLRKSALLLAVAAGLLAPTGLSAAPDPAAKDSATKPDATHKNPLVSTEWLEKNLDARNLRIVEVSVEPGVFERGHIPGAQNVVWHTDLVETVSRDIAGPDKFTALARRLGIDRDTTVVLYGDNNNWFAAWGAWVLAQYGLVDTVKLLDGGRKKWEAEKRPLDTRTGEVAPSAWPGRSATSRSSTSARPTSSAARSSRPPASRNWRSARATSPARSTSPGPRR